MIVIADSFFVKIFEEQVDKNMFFQEFTERCFGIEDGLWRTTRINEE